jgi:hypothetical protein
VVGKLNWGSDSRLVAVAVEGGGDGGAGTQ